MVSRSNCSEREKIPFKMVYQIKFKALKNIDIKKASGIDTIPPKIIRLSASLCDSITQESHYTNIAQNVFPEKSITVLVIPPSVPTFFCIFFRTFRII